MYEKLAQSFQQNSNRDFWNEVKKLRGRKSCSPTNIDSIKGDDNINGLFSNKYKNLYNSVSYDVNQMNILKTHVSNEIVSHSCESHTVMVHNVVSSVKLLKSGKHDGNKGHFTNHLIHGTHRLHCFISILFDSMISHRYVPDDMLLSTLIPIPKNKRKSLNSSDNYRAIALSSVMGKLLDHILLNKCKDVFTTSSYQFGFKAPTQV